MPAPSAEEKRLAMVAKVEAAKKLEAERIAAEKAEKKAREAAEKAAADEEAKRIQAQLEAEAVERAKAAEARERWARAERKVKNQKIIAAYEAASLKVAFVVDEEAQARKKRHARPRTPSLFFASPQAHCSHRIIVLIASSLAPSCAQSLRLPTPRKLCSA